MSCASFLLRFPVHAPFEIAIYVLCMLPIETAIYVLCMLPIEVAIYVLCMLPVEIAIYVLCMLPIETAINITGTLQCLRVSRLFFTYAVVYHV